MTTPSNNSQMHNDIIATGSQERPPMLAPRHYAQWSSSFIRYVDTKSNKDQLRYYIEQGSYILTEIVHEEVPATEEQLAQPCRVKQETYANTTPESRKLIGREAEAIHMILNGIGDDIYSTVDACSTAREMWLAIERLQQGESINKQDVKTKLFWEFGKVTFRDGESIESYYSKFYKMMNEMVRNKLKVDTMHMNVQFLQLQPEWSRFVTIVKQQQDLDTIARNANPLALVAAAQHYPDKYSSDTYYQALKPHKTYTSSSRHTTPTSSHATTRNKSKKIAKSVTPPSEFASEENSDPKQAQRDKDIQKNLSLIAKYIKNIYKPTNNNLRTSSNTRNKTRDTSPRSGNDRQCGQFGNQMTVTVAKARETIGGERQHSEQRESINDTYVVETVNSNVIPDLSDMCDNEGQANQNADNLEDEVCCLLLELQI
ncbi:hypothetical protein Tco_0009359 [Tanacetum coccineum]